MAEALLELGGLIKRFGALLVTDEVSLAVRPGEIHAVIGPNGAGKTSLVQQISGILAPDGGRILLDGRDITALPPHRRARLGLARGFQITSVLAEFSVRENVALAAQAIAGSSFRFFRPAAGEAALNAAADAALDRVGLAARAADPAHRLSHGEKRQLELAMALAQHPRLLLLDEPLAGAGPDETARLVTLLDAMRGDCAILLVEHDMQAVFALADTVSVLAQGRLVASGPPAAIRADAAVRELYLGETG
ncbi:MAG: ABC transporter ATP-binding protein [Rhodospirillales bacterium]|nr:ABC transporter ATP-binding protein [Rhodospirillales bacterium]MDE2575935.1 ABC transporter ATP-binding protein [Rhodospirillales bacterium]